MKYTHEEMMKAVDGIRAIRAVECEVCFAKSLQGRIGGAAMTGWNCLKCNRGELSGSTSHPRYCMLCAIVSKKCQWCWQDLMFTPIKSR